MRHSSMSPRRNLLPRQHNRRNLPAVIRLAGQRGTAIAEKARRVRTGVEAEILGGDLRPLQPLHHIARQVELPMPVAASGGADGGIAGSGLKEGGAERVADRKSVV